MGGGSPPSMSTRPPRVGDTLELRGPSGVVRTLRISGIVSNGFRDVQRFSSNWHADNFAGATVRRVSCC